MRRYPTLAEVERRYVLSILALCGNNRTNAAKVLGISLRGLRLKLHAYEAVSFEVAKPLPQQTSPNSTEPARVQNRARIAGLGTS